MKTSRWTVIFALILVGVLVGGCAKRAEVADQEAAVEFGAQKPAPAAAPVEAPIGSSEEDRGYAASDVSRQERMIIRTVSMSVLVEDTDKTLEQVRALAASYDGYVADSNRWMINDTQAMAQITIRVPADSLDAALEALRGMVLKVEHEASSGQDVTEEYTDVQARLRNLEATEKELLALLTEVRENRGKAEDILAVYRELTSIREQIETLKGRSQYLEQMTALATITIEIRPAAVPATVVEPYQWNPQVTASRALRSLVSFGRVAIDVAIYLIIFSPVVIIPALIIWVIVRAVRRGRKSKSAAAG